jgi:hypothetical protein
MMPSSQARRESPRIALPRTSVNKGAPASNTLEASVSLSSLAFLGCISLDGLLMVLLGSFEDACQLSGDDRLLPTFVFSFRSSTVEPNQHGSVAALSKVPHLWGICPTSENHEQLYFASQQTMDRWKASLELFARCALLQAAPIARSLEPAHDLLSKPVAVCEHARMGHRGIGEHAFQVPG